MVRNFLAEQFHGRALRFDDVRAADVHRFIVLQAQAGIPYPCKACGHGAAFFPALSAGSAGCWRPISPPRCLAWLDGVCRTCQKPCPPNRSSDCWHLVIGGTPAGRRDYAILMLLARLGLRGGEVSAHDPGRYRLGMRRDRRTWQRSTAGTAAPAGRCRVGSGRLSASRSAGLFDPPRFHSRDARRGGASSALRSFVASSVARSSVPV